VRHGAVVVHDFADHAGGIEPGDASQINGSLCLPCAHQHASIARSQRINMPGPGQIVRLGVGVGSRKNGGRPVPRAGARRRTALRVDRLAERSAECGGVARRNRLQVEFLAALFGEREADQAAPIFGHEIDGLRCDFFRRHGQIAFVFAVFIVNEDNHPPLADLLDRLFDACKWSSTFSHGDNTSLARL